MPKLLVKGRMDWISLAVHQNLPANAGDTGLIPGPGEAHMP